MLRDYYFDEALITEGRKKIAQEIIDVLVNHNLSNLEADIILDIVSYYKRLLRITHR